MTFHHNAKSAVQTGIEDWFVQAAMIIMASYLCMFVAKGVQILLSTTYFPAYVLTISAALHIQAAVTILYFMGKQ